MFISLSLTIGPLTGGGKSSEIEYLCGNKSTVFANAFKKC